MSVSQKQSVETFTQRLAQSLGLMYGVIEREIIFGEYYDKKRQSVLPNPSIGQFQSHYDPHTQEIIIVSLR